MPLIRCCCKVLKHWVLYYFIYHSGDDLREKVFKVYKLHTRDWDRSVSKENIWYVLNYNSLRAFSTYISLLSKYKTDGWFPLDDKLSSPFWLPIFQMRWELILHWGRHFTVKLDFQDRCESAVTIKGHSQCKLNFLYIYKIGSEESIFAHWEPDFSDPKTISQARSSQAY